VEDITSERLRRSEAEAIDEERRRIAQEIHDGVAQDLAALRLRVSLWYDWLEQDPAKMIAELDEFQSILDREILDMRRAILGLRPVALEEVGLVPALRRLVEDFENQHQAHVTLNVSGPEQRLPLELELPLFRVVQEALRNVGKHARASLVRIDLDLTQAKAVRLTVRDNGLGFDPAGLPGVVRDGHLGLKQMGERVEAVGGRLEMHSVPGQGTEMRVELPLG
jgi:two-component system sensor histidine kinase DegS